MRSDIGGPLVTQRRTDWATKFRLAHEANTRSITIEDVSGVIEDPTFQREDFVDTYWDRATPLEKIVSLVMAAEPSVRTLNGLLELLSKKCALDISARDLDDALQRLVDLRSILRRAADGYDFAVKAFPRVLAGTETLDDMLKFRLEDYGKEMK